MKRLIYIAVVLALLLTACGQKQPVIEETQLKVETQLRAETTTEEETYDRRGSDTADTGNDGTDADTGTDRADTAPLEEIKTAEELMDEVLTRGINGSDREEFLGDRYDEVQRLIDEKYSIEMPTYVYDDTTYVYQPDTGVYYGDGALNPEDGVNYYGGVLETYYNMDMGPWLDYIYDCGFEGEYWVRSDGVKMFGDYVIVAADYSYEPMGTIVETSLGTGMVLDTGLGGWGWHDIAVSW